MSKPKIHPRHILDRVLLNSDLSHKSAVMIKEFMEGNFDKKKFLSIQSVINEFAAQVYPIAKKKASKKPNIKFMKPLKPSKELAEIVGSKPLPRTQIVSKIWDYIKKHNLQNPKNKRNIMCDEKMEKLFERKEISMFDLAQLVNKHPS